jgi:hypothetical protein
MGYLPEHRRSKDPLVQSHQLNRDCGPPLYDGIDHSSPECLSRRKFYRLRALLDAQKGWQIHRYNALDMVPFLFFLAFGWKLTFH